MNEIDRKIAEIEVIAVVEEAGQLWSQYEIYSPSTDWRTGGPLIEKYGLTINPCSSTNGTPTLWTAGLKWPMEDEGFNVTGKTPLEAACKAIIASKEET